MSLLRLDPEQDALRVLLVEDDEDDYVFLRDLLEEIPDRSYELEWVSDYDEALERMRERRHHLYILDYRLEARTGVELLEEESVEDLHAPAIVLTGVGDREADEAAARAGASDFLSKGRIDSAILDRAIRYSVETKRQAELQRFLAQASRILTASLEYETSVGAAARVVVPRLADWSMLYVAGETGQQPAVEVVHHDPARDEDVRLLAALAEDHAPSGPTRRAMARGRAVVLDGLQNEGRLAEILGDEDYRSVVERLGVASAVVVPLRGKGRVLGALVLASADPGQRYRAADRPFFDDLGTRVALSLENARLFRAAGEATRIRDEVLSMVSHDLGNPLAAVSIACGRIEKRLEEVDDVDLSRFVEMIRSAGDSMERLIEDLLDVARIETGRHFGLERRPEPVVGIVEAGAERFRHRAEAQRITLRTELEEPIPDVMVDRERVIQVLSNLLSNALKFTPPEGEVCVWARSEGDAWVRISVIDEGPGISGEEMEHLFDRFWQARRHRRGGAGLGLTITKEIVDAHGGLIWAESTEGEGSTFHFTVPTVEASDLEAGPG